MVHAGSIWLAGPTSRRPLENQDPAVPYDPKRPKRPPASRGGAITRALHGSRCVICSPQRVSCPSSSRLNTGPPASSGRTSTRAGNLIPSSRCGAPGRHATRRRAPTPPRNRHRSTRASRLLPASRKISHASTPASPASGQDSRRQVNPLLRTAPAQTAGRPRE